jgi:hypothetical protein
MSSNIITFQFDIKALHYLNSNSSNIRATVDAEGNIDFATAALKYYQSTTPDIISLESEEDVIRFKHVARRFFNEFSNN